MADSQMIAKPLPVIKLGERMKQYEKNVLPKNIQADKSYIIRLDGCCFSKFTKPFKSPFDIVFVKAMCFTVKDLLDKFKARTGYTHSDEITLIFSQQESELATHLYDGRTSKLLSVVASYCSVRFNYHLIREIEKFKAEYSDAFIEKIQNCEQTFDARLLIIEPDEIVNHQIWRSVQDCHRNAVSTYADTLFSYKQLYKKNTIEKIEMLKEKNIIWDTIPTFIKYGVYCKKTQYEIEVSGEKVLRSRYEFKNFKINFSDETIAMLIAKFWTAGYGESIDVALLEQGCVL